MVQIMSIVLATAAMLSPAMGAYIRFNAYGPGDCQAKPNTSYDGDSGAKGCYNFNSASYGAQYELLSGGGTCIFKSWESKDCHGKATTRTITGSSSACYPIADKSGQPLYLQSGARSVSITCSG